MVLAELSGGLGNQLFQWAYARGLSENVKCDASKMRNYAGVPRTFSLGPFGIRDSRAATGRDRYIAIGARGYEFVDIGEGDDVRVRGVWMGEGPWRHAAADVRRVLDVPGPTIDAIAVHVRRTDFLLPNSPMVELGADYYRRALERVPRNLPVLVFTDAPDWARQNVPGILIDEPDQYRAMWLMSRCRHHVIANSSFSWWAAWLGEKGVVVAPSRWLKNNDAVTTQIVPERWATV